MKKLQINQQLQTQTKSLSKTSNYYFKKIVKLGLKPIPEQVLKFTISTNTSFKQKNSQKGK